MLHELNARMMGDPRESLLTRLAKEGAPIPEALAQLGALHAGHEEKHLPLRAAMAHSGEHHFPHPTDVPELLIALCQQINTLWESCQSPEDDLYVAAFSLYGMYAILPFETVTAKASVDLMQYLLMMRWQIDAAPLDLPLEGPKFAAGVFVDLYPACDGDSPESFYNAREALGERFQSCSLAHLKETKSFQIVVEWLRAATNPALMPQVA